MKRLTLFIASFMFTLSASAQGLYSGENGDVKGDGFSYRYFTNMFTKILVNADNRFVGKPQTYKGPMEIPQGIRHFTKINISHSELKNLVLKQLSAEQKELLKDSQFSPIMMVDAQTGRVADVIYTLGNNSDPKNQLPVDTYRKIELALKEMVVFVVTEDCRNLNYFIHPVMIQL